MADSGDMLRRLDDIEQLVRGNQERGAVSMRLLTEVVAEMTKPRGDVADGATFISFFDTLPVPAWLKLTGPDGVLRMAWINAAYERDVGVSAATYVGNHDGAVWDETVVADFEANDRRVIEGELVVPTAELAAGQIWRGYKWPLVQGGEIKGVFGFALGFSA